MADLAEQQLVSDLARDLVLQTAPQELPLFRANSEAFFKDPDALTAGKGAKDEMLGFGPGEAMALMTPAILAVTSDIVKFLMDEAKKTAQAEGSALVSETIKRAFKKYRTEEKRETEERLEEKPAVKPEVKPEVQPLPLTPQQLALVRELALKKTRQMKLSEARCKLLADALVGSIAVSQA